MGDDGTNRDGTDGGRAARPAPQHRVCHEPGCSTLLSVYNEFDHCSLHQPMVVPRMRGVVLDD